MSDIARLCDILLGAPYPKNVDTRAIPVDDCERAAAALDRQDHVSSRGGPRDPVAIWFDRAKEAEAALAAAEQDNRRLREALERYKHCRHACIDCFCVKDARAALSPASK